MYIAYKMMFVAYKKHIILFKNWNFQQNKSLVFINQKQWNAVLDW